jgi:hypothetical protein
LTEIDVYACVALTYIEEKYDGRKRKEKILV